MSLSFEQLEDPWQATVDRAYLLAETGQFADLEGIKVKLRQEGHIAVLTALRSPLVRRQLRALCRRAGLRSD